MLYYYISSLFICDSYATTWWPIIGIKFLSYSVLYFYLIVVVVVVVVVVCNFLQCLENFTLVNRCPYFKLLIFNLHPTDIQKCLCSSRTHFGQLVLAFFFFPFTFLVILYSPNSTCSYFGQLVGRNVGKYPANSHILVNSHAGICNDCIKCFIRSVQASNVATSL